MDVVFEAMIVSNAVRVFPGSLDLIAAVPELGGIWRISSVPSQDKAAGVDAITQRLPTCIFYAQGAKTNVLFFTRGETDQGNTREVWGHDIRANMPRFGKRRPFSRDDFRTPQIAPAEMPCDKFTDVFGEDSDLILDDFPPDDESADGVAA